MKFLLYAFESRCWMEFNGWYLRIYPERSSFKVENAIFYNFYRTVNYPFAQVFFRAGRIQQMNTQIQLQNLDCSTGGRTQSRRKKKKIIAFFICIYFVFVHHHMTVVCQKIQGTYVFFANSMISKDSFRFIPEHNQHQWNQNKNQCKRKAKDGSI